jgi:hypothetical protein
MSGDRGNPKPEIRIDPTPECPKNDAALFSDVGHWDFLRISGFGFSASGNGIPC